MKKLLMSAIVLSCFGIAISLFQISCQKDATAQTGGSFTLPPATTTTLGGIIVGSGLNVTSSGVISVPYGNSTAQINKVIYSKANNGTYEIWVCNYDGSGAAKVNITLPNGINFFEPVPAMSPNGQKIFFTAGPGSGSSVHGDLYSCNFDGTNVTKIAGDGVNNIHLGGAY